MNVNSDLLHKIRVMSGLSMRKMAERLNISAGYINAIEKQREPLTDSVKYRLYKEFDLDAHKVAEYIADYEKYRK